MGWLAETVKMIIEQQTKAKTKTKTKRCENMILISVDVVGGSPGPIRLIVNQDDVVADVVSRILKVYAREERLPVLEFNAKDFKLSNLFCPADESTDLDPHEKIGQCGDWGFVLRKETSWLKTDDDQAGKVSGKGTGAWRKSWINKSLEVVIPVQ